MSGVGDNFQLHTPRRAPRGSVGRGRDHRQPIYRRFRLFDGRGAYVFPEGRPDDIEPLDGVRVVVPHPPRGNYGWIHGRVYEHMEPYFTDDQELAPAEAADWLARVPAPSLAAHAIIL